MRASVFQDLFQKYKDRWSDTADAALKQIETKDYASELREAGVTEILQYGFAFAGKTVLIKKK